MSVNILTLMGYYIESHLVFFEFEWVETVSASNVVEITFLEFELQWPCLDHNEKVRRTTSGN